MRLIIGILIFLLIFTFSCKKPQQYPTIPQISYKSYEIRDTIDLLDNVVKRGKLKFYVIDGDGDIGLSEADSIAPYNLGSLYYHNLFLTMYEKIDGKFEKVDLTVPLNYRIPYVVPQGQNKTLKADIIVDIDFPQVINYDTIKYDFFIFDRALNQSNIISSPEIIIN